LQRHTDTRRVSATTKHYYKAIQFIMKKHKWYSFAGIVTAKHRLDQINEAVRGMMTSKEIKPVIVP
jgi:hypothetical protein